MTVNTVNIVSGPYTGNGVADAFAFTFRIEDKSQIQVWERDLAGAWTLKVVDTDYTVSGLGVDAGGTITRVAGPLATNYKLYIRANYVATQLTDFESQGAFYPDVHESAMDKLTFLIQQLQDQADRSIRLAPYFGIDGSLELESEAADRASTVIGFDNSGNAILFDKASTNLVPPILYESATLASGQVTVIFTNDVEKASFYISGPDADNGRLAEGVDYAADYVTNTVNLTESYPAGTILTLVYNDVGSSEISDYNRVFENITSLKSAVLATGIVVRTKGYTTAGDGGHAEYLIKSAGDYGGTPDEIWDHTLANGVIAVFQSNNQFSLVDGVSPPGTKLGLASIYVDSADGDLKVKFGDGVVKTIVTDA